MSIEARDSFDPVAEQYHRARPGYPDALLDALAEQTGIVRGSRVLEIGPGTGQATAAFLARGAVVTAVERGRGLSAVLRRELPTQRLDVVTAEFEEWTAPRERFDLVVAFTSWHWLDPAIRTEKVARMLRPGSWLVTVSTTHVVDEPGGFFDAMQPCYQRWMPTDSRRPPRSSDVMDQLDEADDSRSFEPAERRRFTQDVEYSAAQYTDVLGTYSNHLALTESDRASLFACLTALLNADFDGRVTKRYLYEVRTARRARAK